MRSGMVVGLGTGSTAYFAVERVGEKVCDCRINMKENINVGSSIYEGSNFVIPIWEKRKAVPGKCNSGVVG